MALPVSAREFPSARSTRRPRVAPRPSSSLGERSVDAPPFRSTRAAYAGGLTSAEQERLRFVEDRLVEVVVDVHVPELFEPPLGMQVDLDLLGDGMVFGVAVCEAATAV